MGLKNQQSISTQTPKYTTQSIMISKLFKKTKQLRDVLSSFSVFLKFFCVQMLQNRINTFTGRKLSNIPSIEKQKIAFESMDLFYGGTLKVSCHVCMI